MKAILIPFLLGFAICLNAQTLSYKKVYLKNNMYYLKKDSSVASGIITGYYMLHKKRYEINIKDGLKDGNESWWFCNGKVKTTTCFSKGYENGTFIQSFRNGNMHIKIAYIKGKEEGSWEQWYRNGKKSIDAN